MKFSAAVMFTTVFIAPALFCAGQTASRGTEAPESNTPNVPFTPAAPSEILQRSLGEVQQVVGGLKLDKWKRGSVRDESGTNVAAIQRDLGGTLPKLIADGDAAPATLSKVLPVARNVDALYDVLVHLFEAARVSAPGDQVGQLQTAMEDLEKARVTLGNQLQQTAALQEKQIVDLRVTMQTQAASLRAASSQPPPKCPAPATPAKKKRVPAKTTPAKTAPAATTPGAAAKPPGSTAKPQQ